MLNSRIVNAIAGKRYLFLAMCLTVAGCSPPAHQSAASDGKHLEARVPGDRESAQKSMDSSEIAPPSSYHVFAVLDHRGTHYELSDEPVPTCVHLEGEDRWPWKLAWIEGRWMGTVKSCWYRAHREKELVNPGPGSNGDIITVPAHDEIVVCLPYAPGKGSQHGNGPACQNIDPAYFIAVESLPHPAFETSIY